MIKTPLLIILSVVASCLLFYFVFEHFVGTKTVEQIVDREREIAFREAKQKINYLDNYAEVDPNLLENASAISRQEFTDGEWKEIKLKDRTLRLSQGVSGYTYEVIRNSEPLTELGYNSEGQLETVGFKSRTSFPYRVLIYSYPNKALDTVEVIPNKLCNFGFYPDGTLIPRCTCEPS